MKQVVLGNTTSKERMDFCRKQPGNHFTGAQGLSLVFDLMRDKLPKSFWHASFDEEDRLPFVDGYRGVPFGVVFSDGDFRVSLGDLGGAWGDNSTFLSFCDESLVV